MIIPPLARVRQKLPSPPFGTLAAEITKEMASFQFSQRIESGSSVVIVVGSRGIDNLSGIVATVVQAVRDCGGVPFIAPGMGSHGGATAAGQAAVLRKLGVSENIVGAPIHSSMETLLLQNTAEGYPVYCDEAVANADAVILINRIKPHTSFSGEIESGLMKMAAVGLGKDVGCRAIHAAGLGNAIIPVGRMMMQTLKRVMGLAILEDQYGKTCCLKLLAADEVEAEEKKLLLSARKLVPKLPFRAIDLLIVEEMGKNISGTGMDAKVIGRVNRKGVRNAGPYIDKIIVLDLTDASEGNALGIGMADITTRRLVEKIDYHKMYENGLSTRHLDRVKIPVTMDNDREAILLGLRTMLNPQQDQLKVVRIKNTLDLLEFSVSEALLLKVKANRSLAIQSGLEELQFDLKGGLLEQHSEYNK